MSLFYVAHASEAFLAALDEAQAMARAGQMGPAFDDLLQHASELLEVMDEELTDVDGEQHAQLFAAAPILRQKLEAFRAELRRASAH